MIRMVTYEKSNSKQTYGSPSKGHLICHLFGFDNELWIFLSAQLVGAEHASKVSDCGFEDTYRTMSEDTGCPEPKYQPDGVIGVPLAEVDLGCESNTLLEDILRRRLDKVVEDLQVPYVKSHNILPRHQSVNHQRSYEEAHTAVLRESIIVAPHPFRPSMKPLLRRT